MRINHPGLRRDLCSLNCQDGRDFSFFVYFLFIFWFFLYPIGNVNIPSARVCCVWWKGSYQYLLREWGLVLDKRDDFQWMVDKITASALTWKSHFLWNTRAPGILVLILFMQCVRKLLTFLEQNLYGDHCGARLRRQYNVQQVHIYSMTTQSLFEC